MNKLLFIIGMRRSGTSILRKLVMNHPEIDNIEFEPNELFEVTERIDIPRYKNLVFFKDTINRFKNHNTYYGGKLAINPGIEGMRWVNLPIKFPDAKFIFIQRNPKDTYKSWVDSETSKRGFCSYEMYLPCWEHINKSFIDFTLKSPKKAVIVNYIDIINNVNDTMNNVWDLLNIKRISGLEHFIKKPKHGAF